MKESRERLKGVWGSLDENERCSYEHNETLLFTFGGMPEEDKEACDCDAPQDGDDGEGKEALSMEIQVLN